MEKNNKPTINQTFDVIKKIIDWNSYLNKERFISYAKSKIPISDKQAAGLWEVWCAVTKFNFYQLEKYSEKVIETAMLIASGAYEAVCKGANIRWRENKPNTTKWKVYYQHKDKPIQHIVLNLLEKEDIIKYAHLLQQEETEIKLRVDYYETVELGYGVDREKVDIYDGDIIFCTDTEKIFLVMIVGHIFAQTIVISDCYTQKVVVTFARERHILSKGKMAKIADTTLMFLVDTTSHSV